MALKHRVVSHEEWIEARKRHLAGEKEFTRARDRLAQERRELPWERVEKSYAFEGPEGSKSLSQLFGSSSQLIVYHFMYDPDWDVGCKSCSFWADNFDHIPVHLKARDTAFVAVSRARLAQIEAYKKRMGWSFPWYSSYGSDFNRDIGVSFTSEEVEKDLGYWNYAMQALPDTEGPGISVFCKDGDAIYHTYSCYSRGIDLMNGAYNYLDLTPKGRDEADGVQRWLRRHDEYGT